MSDHSQFAPYEPPFMAAYRKRQEGKGEKHSVAKEAIFNEIDPTQKEVRTEAKHDAIRKHLASHKDKVREDTKAKNRRRGKKGA